MTPLRAKSWIYLVLSWETTTTAAVYYTCFNKCIMRLNTKSKQKPAGKKMSRLFFYYYVPTYPDLPVFTCSNQILKSIKRSKKCCTLICCLYFSSPKNQQWIASFLPSPLLLLLHCTAAATAAAAAAAAPAVLLCCSFRFTVASIYIFSFRRKFCTQERNYTTRKWSWRNSKDHSSYVCVWILGSWRYSNAPRRCCYCYAADNIM